MVTFKLFGTIATDFGGRNLDLTTVKDAVTLKELLITLKNLNEEKFTSYFDNDLTPKRGTLILVNGVDFNTLEGLETIIILTDQVSLIPTISGG